MSVVDTEYLDIPTRSTSVRALIVRPRGLSGRAPAVLAWSDIFQQTPPHVRLMKRIASYGFVVVSPEIYSRVQRPGTVHDFEADRQQALDDASVLQLEGIDEERRDVLDWTRARADVSPDRMGAAGWCFGGHLAFRAAAEPEITATACFYPTGVHSGDIGATKATAGTLERAPQISGEVLLVFGARDPYVPEAGRDAITSALERAGVVHAIRTFDAEHAFMRDEGPRYDGEASDLAVSAMIELFRRRLGGRAH